MATFISHNPIETESLGEEWGRVAASGWVIGLSGDLGAGKTQLVKGLAHGLGVTERIHSPTFALVNEYSTGRLPLFHLDLYRLETRKEIIGAGLDEYFFQLRGVVVVEWIERWGTAELEKNDGRKAKDDKTPSQKSDLQSPASGVSPDLLFRHVRLEILDETRRRITYEDFGR